MAEHGARRAAAPRGLRGSRSSRLADPAFRRLLALSGAAVLGVLAWMIVSTTSDAWPILRQEGLGLFTSAEWSPGGSRDPNAIEGSYGGLEFFFGTIVSSTLALLLAVPLAVGVALYVTQLAPARVRQPLANAVDLLAAVPSVVYGLWGSLFLVPLLIPVMGFLADTLGSVLPWFAPPVRVRNLFMASLVLALMVLPIISAVVREVMATAPKEERWAAYGLGATRWEVIRHVVLPRARGGIIGASMLGLGRALGETIAVLLIIGGNARLSIRLFDTQQTVAAQIAAAFGEASPEHIRGLLALGVGLFAITIAVNMLARVIVNRFGPIAGDAAL